MEAGPAARAWPEEFGLNLVLMLLGSFHLGGKTGSRSSLWCLGCEVCFRFVPRSGAGWPFLLDVVMRAHFLERFRTSAWRRFLLSQTPNAW